MGGTHSLACNEIAREVWLWCISRKIYLTAAHIPGKENIQADQPSRLFNDRTEWKLDKSVFTKLLTIFGKPVIDMFASRLNHHLASYVAWIPDPDAMAVDKAHKTIDSRTSAPPTGATAPHTTTSTQKDTSVERETHPDGLSLIRASLTGRCISEQAQEILLQSWHKGTKKQYETFCKNGYPFVVNGILIPCNQL